MFYVYDKKGNRYGVKDTNDNVVEYYSAHQLFDICSNRQLNIRILGVKPHNKTIGVAKVSFYGYWDVIDRLKTLLKRNGVTLGIDDELYEDDLSYSTRFIGGMSSWSGDEDLCDADYLDDKVRKLIRKTCEEFARHTGISVSWLIDEKGWSTFRFN